MNTPPGVLLALVLLALAAAFRPGRLLEVVHRLHDRIDDGLDQLGTALDERRDSAIGKLVSVLSGDGSRQDKASHFHRLLGAVLLGATSLAVLLGDAVLGMEAVCGILQSSCRQVSGRFDEGTMFFLSLLGGTTLWGILGAELLGWTHIAPWWGRLGEGTQRRLILPVLCGAMFLLGFLVLVSLAVYRVEVTAAPIFMEGLAEVLQGTQWIRTFSMVGGGAMVAMAAPVAVIALSAFAEVSLLSLGVALVWVTLGFLAAIVSFIRWVTEFLCEGFQDLVRLVGGHRLEDHEDFLDLDDADLGWDAEGVGPMADFGGGVDVPGAQPQEEPGGWQ